MTPNTGSDAERALFEAALKANPDVRFWNTSDAMLWAWQAARSLPMAGRDAERLDFLDSMPGHKWMASQSGLGRGFRVHQDKEGTYNTARQAIDAAIALKQQEPS